MKALAFVVAAALAGGVQEADFRYTRALPDAVADGRVAFEPDNRLLGHANDGLTDLRVLDAEGNQVPWRFAPGSRRTIGRAATVLNSGRSAGQAVALVDVGPSRQLYERVELGIAGGRFVGRVTAYGADRRAGPFTRLSTTTVFDVAGATHARSTTVVLPPTDFRFLELRASGVQRITAATVLAGFERPALVRRPHALLDARDGARSSVATLDLGIAGVPVTRVEVGASEPGRYDRPVSIAGSNDRRTFVPLAAGRITRAPGLSSPGLELYSRFRYLRVTVSNGDDPPLRGLMTQSFGPSYAVLVEGGHARPLRVVYGAAVRGPDYEFARLPVDRPVAVLEPSRLPSEQRNPAFALPGQTFGERNRWLVQAGLGLSALVVAVGGVLALRRRAQELD